VSESPGRGLKALVVDDDPAVQNLVRTVLELDGWEVQVASDGEAGLAAAEDFKPNGIVLDVMMPGKDGFAVLTELRQTAHGREAAIILLTAKSQPADMFRGSKLGADLYVTKPFEPDLLSERLAFHTLRRNPAARATGPTSRRGRREG
jgi:two-component system OmpR family response regulator